MSKPVELSDANFKDEVLSATEPVLVDFWAEWCAPCRMIAPTVEQIADEYEGKIKVGKLDVDKSPGIASKYGVRSIPTLLIFKGGKVIEQIVGAVPKHHITPKLEAALS